MAPGGRSPSRERTAGIGVCASERGVGGRRVTPAWISSDGEKAMLGDPSAAGGGEAAGGCSRGTSVPVRASAHLGQIASVPSNSLLQRTQIATPSV